jgi:hypothetical protein
MDRQEEAEILKLIECKERELQFLMETLPESGTLDELITPMVELTELQNELEFLRSEPSGSDEPDVMVGVPRKPRPHLNSGAVALPEPD